MMQKPAWWDRNIGDSIDSWINAWRERRQEKDLLGDAQKHLNARAGIFSGVNLPPGYEMEFHHRAWNGAKTSIWMRAPMGNERNGEKKNEWEEAAAKHQAAMNDVLSKTNFESAKDAAEGMTHTENHDRENGKPERGQEKENLRERKRQQAQEKEQNNDQER